MENVVTADELKTKGISRLDEITASGDEAIISVRGKKRYVVLTLEPRKPTSNGSVPPEFWVNLQTAYDLARNRPPHRLKPLPATA